MAAFATAADLATRLGITLTTDEQTRATALLESASGLVREAAKQDLDLVEGDTLTMRGTNEPRILLPQRPVVEVTSVTLDGSELSGWYLDGNVLVRNGYDADGVTLNWWGVGFGSPAQELAVTYSHGYAADSIPSTASAITLEAVVRVWINPGAVIGERHGSEQVQYGQSEQAGLLLTRGEQTTLRRLFGRRGGSVSQS